ncbi:MAG: GNAT family N-acetyltransferase [Candidatus Eisenbacteria bacterium]
MTARVEPATPNDLDLLVRLMTEFYAESRFSFEALRAHSAFETLLADPRCGRAWLIRSGDEVAGYFVMTLGYSMEFGGLSAFLDDLFIRAAFRGRGFGRTALATLRAECEALGVRVVHLEAERDNEAAQRLYRAAGFAGRDLQLLTLRLSEPLHDGE